MSEKTKTKGLILRDIMKANLELAGFDVEEGEFSDGSSNWIDARKHSDMDKTICFTFSKDGKELTDVGVWEDEIETTTQKKLF